MCGIVGYVGKRNVKDVLLNSISYLEYRGYDSSGICTLENNKLRVYKSVGKLDALRDKLKRYNLDDSICGMVHTRWATHGEVSEVNSHPHHVGRVAIVHNGIVENYKEIEKILKNKYDFKSKTDTERVCALIDSFYDGNNEIEAINEAIKLLKGSYALCIMFEGNDKIYGVKKDAPLILGIGNNELFLTSDICAIVEYTKKYIILEDNETVEIGKNYKISYDGILINHRVLETNLSVSESQKGGYEHFMLKEINEQDDLAKKLYAKYIPNDKISDAIIDISKYKRIDFVSCGSAYHASLIGKYFIDKYCTNNEFYCNSYIASEYRYTNHYFDSSVLVILISQSGETADTLACLRMCNEEGVDTLAIVNVISSTMAREAKYVLPILAGPEICVATTKAYFAQSYLCSLLCLKCMYRKKIINIGELNKILKDFKDLPNNIRKVIDNNIYEKIAKSIYKNKDMFYIGRGIDIYVAKEASLKIKEISYIHSESLAAGELKHGPISLIEKGFPVISLLSEFSVYNKTISNIIEAKSRGAKIIIIRKESIVVDPEVYDYEIVVPLVSEFVEHLLIVISTQLLAYYVAKLKGCDIDKPKNLAKSVTVE